MLGVLACAGSGRTRALGHVAVVVTDQQLDNPATLAVIDMSGPVAQLTAFARTHNVVISAWPAPSAGRSEYLAAIRQAGLRAAVYLARAARGAVADAVEVFDLPAPTRVPPELAHLPRIAYVFQIHSHQRPTGIDEGILYGDPCGACRRPWCIPTRSSTAPCSAASWDAPSRPGHPEPSDHPRGCTAARAHAVVRRCGAHCAQATEPERVRSAAMAAGLVADVLGADGALHQDRWRRPARGHGPGGGLSRGARREDDAARRGHVHDGARRACCCSTSRLDALVNVGAPRRRTLPPMARVIDDDPAGGASTYGGHLRRHRAGGRVATDVRSAVRGMSMSALRWSAT